MVTFTFNDLRDITSHIFLNDTFDFFLLYEAEFTTSNIISIDGALQKNFFDSDELEQMDETDYIRWSRIKPVCFSLIKGKKLPLSFKITLKLSEKDTERFISQNCIHMGRDELTGLLLNLRYDKNKLTAVTGTSTRDFVLDRSYEKAWDEMIIRFFKKKEILIEYL